ncbi:peritrophin-1-like [Diorhabda sublineata]|uniref:peritrophin-1-like n=1 Tax=Diorhabda sublineata TaxID=1163346 RepID=UPI0024E0D77F|nr:peritrophin-1-like [Diorhabda sublineata]
MDYLIGLCIVLMAGANVLAIECPLPGDSITFYPDYTNCSRYIECYKGEASLMSCPDGLWWNQKYLTCDYPKDVDCKTDPTATTPSTHSTSEGTTSSGWTPDHQCPYPTDQITYDYDPFDCQKYYECDHGNRYSMTCPDGYLWNHINNYCDFPENVDCSRTITTPKPICDDQDGTFYANTTDCTKYIECVNGEAKDLTCPDDTWWDEIRLTCDYPEYVDCKAEKN